MTQEKRTTHEAVDIVPGRHVLVPIATADSAQEIIDLAFTLMKPGEGHVTVLGSPPTGNEDAASNYAEIAAVVQKYINEGRPIRLRTKITVTVTRSILEAVREWAIDVLLLPLSQSGENDEPSIGNVVDNIVATSSCSVLIYRPAEAAKIDQIVVPVLHEAEESLAKEFRAFLGNRFDKPTQLLAYQTAYEQKTKPDNTLLAIAVSDRSNWESWEEIVAADQRILGQDTALLVLFLPEGTVKTPTTWVTASPIVWSTAAIRAWLSIPVG